LELVGAIAVFSCDAVYSDRFRWCWVAFAAVLTEGMKFLRNNVGALGSCSLITLSMCRPFHHHILCLALPLPLGFAVFHGLLSFTWQIHALALMTFLCGSIAIPPPSMLFLGFLRGLGRFVCFPVLRSAAYYYCYYFLGGEEIFGTNLLRGRVSSYLVPVRVVSFASTVRRPDQWHC
jgi:hypothetical protein